MFRGVRKALRRLRVRWAARLAYRRLREVGGEGVLVGTAALQLHGFSVEAPDVDFLCRDEVVPGGVTAATVNSDDEGSERVLGLPAHYIGQRDEGCRRFYHPEEATVVAGVPVAPLRDVLGLKRWANRKKDREFFLRWDTEPYRVWRVI